MDKWMWSIHTVAAIQQEYEYGVSVKDWYILQGASSRILCLGKNAGLQKTVYYYMKFLEKTKLETESRSRVARGGGGTKDWLQIGTKEIFGVMGIF